MKAPKRAAQSKRNSRRLKLFVSRTSRAVAVGLALRRAMLAWGVPEAVRTDNGSDYISRHVTLGLSALGIQHMICDPFSPDQKPFTGLPLV